MDSQSLEQLAETAKGVFQQGNFTQAAGEFAHLAQSYADRGEALMAAEMRNNQSVSLLQAGQPESALDVVQDTDKIFAQAGDLRRQGLSLGNRAAALEALGRTDEAARDYDQAADLLERAGERDLRAMLLKSRAALDLKRGKVTDSAINMMEHLTSLEKPTFFQRILKFLLRFRLW
ncbi:MAG: hypothetical protein AB1846_18425 [Chloroflexota bacterium]